MTGHDGTLWPGTPTFTSLPPLSARKLLSDATARGAEAARHWHATSAAERRLNAALLGGEGTHALAAAIQDAAAAGVKVTKHVASCPCGAW